MKDPGRSRVEGAPHRVISVVLNYNSADDVEALLPQLMAQTGVDHSIYVVDNGSSASCVDRLRLWARETGDVVFVGTPALATEKLHAIPNGGIALILNSENRGYSAGNNIGIRLATRAGADAVLIVNPDMRIEDAGYVAGLARALFASEKNLIAASRVVDLEGSDQNPLRESGFWEEFAWPLTIVRQRLARCSYVLNSPSKDPTPVPKVSGCCMLIRSSFLDGIGGLDENVFLYCEEPILSAQVRRAGGLIIHVPYLLAVHAHMRSRKGNSSARMLHFIKSRQYYLHAYSGYARWQQMLLRGSYFLMATIHELKRRASRAR